jgi:hypothetical protein
MGNKPEWLNKWGRSPRQDRRVIVDGKFVELTEPKIPEVNNDEGTAETEGPGTAVGSDEGNDVSGVPDATYTGTVAYGEVESPAVATEVPEPVATPRVPNTSEGSLSETLQAELEPLPAPVIPSSFVDAIQQTLVDAEMITGAPNPTEDDELDLQF